MTATGSRLRQIGWLVVMAACFGLFLALSFRVHAVKSEVRLAERFGLTFQHGLGFNSVSPPGDADKLTNFGTFGENVTEAGVWFTF